MPIQLGPCAFTAACTLPPRFRMQGTNQKFCAMHARSMALGLSLGGRASTEAETVVHARLPEGSVPNRFLYSGVVSRK